MRKKAEIGMHSVHMNIVALHSYILLQLTLVSGLYFESQRLIFINFLTICHLVYVKLTSGSTPYARDMW